MSGPFENDTIGLATAVASARTALLPHFQSLDADLDLLESMNRLAQPFIPSSRDVPPYRRRLQGVVAAQKNRFFWREQKVLEMATGLLRRLVVGAAGRDKAKRKSLLFVIPYDIAESRTGGASRLYGLARCLGAVFDINLISLVSSRRDAEAISLYEGVTLYTIPRTGAFMRRIEEQQAMYGGAAALLAMCDGADALPLLSYWIETLGHDCSAVFVDGPPLLEVVRRALPGKPLVYESPNVYQQFMRTLSVGAHADAAVRLAEKKERGMCGASELIVCVSKDDRDFMAARYGVTEDKLMVVPNGVDAGRSVFLPPSTTQRLKNLAGIKRPVALFVGSSHKPNIEAVQFIAHRLCPRFPEIQFFVVGMSVDVFADGKFSSLPDNLTFGGKVSETDKEAAFALADIALCPVVSGSGSSLKIPDYAAHGKPIVSTSFGVRGFDTLAPVLTVAELDVFGNAVKSTLDELANHPDEMERRCTELRHIIELRFDWDAIVAPLLNVVRKLADRAQV